MKIDGNNNNPTLEPLSSQKIDATRSYAAGQAQPGGAPAGDTVQLSADAQLADRLRQAAAAPGVRQDKVDEARRKLDAGQIGQDASALAGRLIDQMLEG